MNKVLEFISNNLRFPSYSEMGHMGITREFIRYHYGNITQFKEYVLKCNPSLLSKFTIKKSKLQSKLYVVTTVFAGHRVNKNFFKALKLYTKTNNAELLIIPVGIDTGIFDPILKNECFIDREVYLNSNLQIIPFDTNITESDPISSVTRIVKKQSSLIIPSSKLRLKYIPIKKESIPRAVMTTGTLCELTNNSITTKRRYLGVSDMVNSAIVVRIENDEFFHFRQLLFKNNSFVDLGKQYSNTGVKTNSNGICVLGDLHVGHTDLTFLQDAITLLKRIKIKTIFLHDVFDAYSISHHDLKKELMIGIKKYSGKGSLKKELDLYVQMLDQLSKDFNIYIVKSNHDEHLERYLIEGRFMTDYENQKLGLQLAHYIYDGKNPLQEYYLQNSKSKQKQRITWLSRDSSFEFGGNELAQHGDVGANGSYASIKQLEALFGNIVFGHTHSPEIFHGAWCVGTSTKPFPFYGIGPSSWMQTFCIIYDNGGKQLINYVNGKLC
ncbi:MAG: hypothetical protein ABIM30_01050 [candidate division WOR-3 bacterium]